MNALGNVANIAGAFQGGIQSRREDEAYARQNALSQAVQAYGPRSPQAMSALGAADPMAAMQMAQPDPRQAQAMREAAGGMIGQVLALPEEQRPQAYAMALRQAAQMGMDLDGVPDEYPGDASLRVMGGLLGMDDGERSEFERLMGSLPPEHAREAMMIKLGLAPDADTALRVGASQAERDPIAGLRARASAAGLQEGTPEYAQFMLEGGAKSGFAVDTSPDGSVSIRQGVGASTVQKPFTEGQSKDNVYVSRAIGALRVLEPIASELTSLGNRALDADPTGIVRGKFQGEQFQVAKQAGDEFLQAVLRKDTGAAITSQEQELYGKTYLPQPGDGPEVLAAKSEARRRAVEAIKSGMSPAQMIAVERGLRSGEDMSAEPPDGVDPIDWEFMSPEDRALFQ